jgi:hypothetical protein
MQHLFAAHHGILGSYLRDALHEGTVDVVACLFVPAHAGGEAAAAPEGVC